MILVDTKQNRHFIYDYFGIIEDTPLGVFRGCWEVFLFFDL